MDKRIKADLYRYNKLNGFSGFLKGMRIQGFKYVFFLRIANRNNKYSPKGFISRLILHWLGYRYGFRINPKAKIGKGLYLGHFGTVLIGNSVIGANCNIGHNVTIGQIPTDRIIKLPILGDKVWVGIGCVIVGNIKIGSNVFISPNTFVNFDVPSNSTVIGNPARIVRMKKNPVEGYINNVIE